MYYLEGHLQTVMKSIFFLVNPLEPRNIRYLRFKLIELFITLLHLLKVKIFLYLHCPFPVTENHHVVFQQIVAKARDAAVI